MTEHMRLGFVGCGDIASYMAWLARFNRRIQITACCDLLPERADSFAQRFKIPQAFTDYNQMLAASNLVAVYLAVPHHLHFEMLQTVIQAGLPVLVEKPLTRTLEEGRRIVQLAQTHHARVGVNYQYRYDRGCYALARAVQKGELGEIYYARINLPWHRNTAYFEQAAWHARLETSGGGTLITQGSHLLDVVLWAIGEQPVNVMGYIAQRTFRHVEVEDLAQATVEMQNGALVQICSSMIATPEAAVCIEAYGSKGTAIYSNRPLPHLRLRGVRISKETPPQKGLHALQRSLEGFRAWVAQGQDYLCPAVEALPTLATVEAIYQSARSGRRQEVYPHTMQKPIQEE
jgi:UDP-N-acetyl-2-amino-2-deoxyglucuronate dehydrogenase